MNQIKELIKKAINDKELMAKLDELGSKGAGDDEIIKLAAENGFTFTKEDIEEFMNQEAKINKLDEEELKNVAGGATQNRYDPNVCPKLTRTRYECVGLFQLCWCDHYYRKFLGMDGPPTGGRGGQRGNKHALYKHECVMGCFNYTGVEVGHPYP